MKLTVSDGCFSYAGGEEILSHIDFSLDDGEILAILGPNGIGKTTLLKCVTGLLKWTRGASFLKGERISDMPPKRLWKKISYVPQARDTNILYTGEEAVLLGRSAHLGMLESPRAKDEQAVNDVFQRLGIESLRKKRCSQMSGGELQMLLIARALAAETGILVLDEPESGLDFKNQLVILNLLKSLSRENGLGCVFNTHYPVHALRIAQKTLILGRDGRCVFGNSAEIVTRENLRVYFGVDVRIDAFQENGEHLFSVTPISIV